MPGVVPGELSEVEVEVDDTLCALALYCTRVAPWAFRERDDAPAAESTVGSPLDPEQLAVLIEAEGTCPTGAIRVRQKSPT